ncbi:YraN family protein [Candidatus Bipolaricaulota bacterium]|nr:YraN family protein [Candidatus Bipolaricaulota bacterium]
MGKGKWAEELACRYLREQGYLIVARNWRWPGGEVDIIAKHGDTLVFVEVKGRRGDSHGAPEEAVDARKRTHLWRSARAFLGDRLGRVPVRFDVIGVGPSGINHVRGAFRAEDVRQGG